MNDVVNNAIKSLENQILEAESLGFYETAESLRNRLARLRGEVVDNTNRY